MIWGAPIWFNEILVKGIKAAVVISMIFSTYSVVYLLNSLYYRVREKEIWIDAYHKRSFIRTLAMLLLSSMILLFFYYPKEVLPGEYSYDAVYVSIVGVRGQKEETLMIKDARNLEAFAKTLESYKRRRRFDSGDTVIDGKTIFISMVIFKGNHSSPYHMIIKEDLQRVYTGANTDFIYIVDNKDDMLGRKVFEYIDSIRTNEIAVKEIENN